MNLPHSNVRKHNTDSIHAHIDAGTGIWFVCTRFIYIFRSSAGVVVVAGAGAAFVWVSCVFRLFLTAVARRASTKILVTIHAIWLWFWFRCNSNSGSTIDRMNALLSVSSWSWIGWEECRARSTIYWNFFWFEIKFPQRKWNIKRVHHKHWTFFLIKLVNFYEKQQNLSSFIGFLLVFLILFTTTTIKTAKKREKTKLLSRKTVRANWTQQ